MNNNDTSTAHGQASGGADLQAQAATSASQVDQNSSNSQQQHASQDDLQRQITELRNENARHRAKNKEQEAAAQAAEQHRLKEQGEFKQLAEKHEARVKELEPTIERYTKLSDLVHEQIKEQISSWPDEVKSLVPGKETPVEERLASLEKLKPLAERFAQQQRGMQPGNSPNPKPSASAPSNDEIKNKMLGSGFYNSF